MISFCIKLLLDDKERFLLDKKTLEDKLIEASAEINRSTDDYIKIRETLLVSDNLLRHKQDEMDTLRSQCDKVVGDVNESPQIDDKIMLNLDQKVEEWRVVC